MPRDWFPHTSPHRLPQRAHLRPSRPLPVWVLVGLLHVGLLLSVWKLPMWGDRLSTVVQRPPLVVRLWQPARQEVAPRPQAAVPKRPATPSRPLRPEPQAITLPTLPTEPAVTAGQEVPPVPPLTAGTTTAAASAIAAAPPLKLTLPRIASAPWRQRNPALDDPRSNTAKLTMEQKLSMAMGGDGSWVQERVDLDTIRYRRGSECIQVKRSRAGQLELAGGAFRNAWLVGGC